MYNTTTTKSLILGRVQCMVEYFELCFRTIKSHKAFQKMGRPRHKHYITLRFFFQNAPCHFPLPLPAPPTIPHAITRKKLIICIKPCRLLQSVMPSEWGSSGSKHLTLGGHLLPELPTPRARSIIRRLGVYFGTNE